MTALSTNTAAGDLVRCGERSIRKPCKYCGRKDGLYWGHDPSEPGHKWCAKHPGMTNFILVESDGSRHNCRGAAGPGIANDDGPDDAEHAEQVPAVNGTVVPAPQAAPAPTFGGVTTDKTQAAMQFAELIRQMAQGTRNLQQIRGLINDEL